MRRWMALGTLLLTLLNSALAQEPAQTLDVPADTVRPALFASVAGFNLRNSKAYDTILLLSELRAFYEFNPHASPQEATAFLSPVESALSAQPITPYLIGHQTADQLVHGGLDIIRDFPAGPISPFLKSATTNARVVWDVTRREFRADLDAKSKLQYESRVDIGQRISGGALNDILYDLAVMAEEDASKASVINQFAGSLGVFVDGTPHEWLATNPEFAESEDIAWIASRIDTIDNHFRSTNTAMLEQLGNVLSTMEENSNDILDSLDTLNRTQLEQYETLREYLEDEARRDAAIQQAQEQQAIQHLRVQAAEAGVYLLSTFFGQSDPRAGRVVRTVGSAALQVNQALSNFSVSAAVLDSSSSDFPGDFTGEQLGSIVLAGSLVNAAMQVATLFQSDEAPEQVILDQIEALRAQVKRLEEVMLERFERIDAQLVDISILLIDALDRLERIDRDITAIQTSLYTLHSSVQRLQQEVHTWLNDIARIDLAIGVNESLGYEQRVGVPMTPQQFNQYESLFLTYATQVARDQLHAGPDFSASIFIHEQLRFPIASNFNFLTQLPSEALGLPSTPDALKRQANPLDWYIAAAAYTQLLEENPELAQQLLANAPERVEAVISTGKDAKSALLGFTNRELFERLLSYYRASQEAVTQELEATRVSFENASLPAALSLWDSADQVAVASANNCDRGPMRRSTARFSCTWIRSVSATHAPFIHL